MRFFYLAIFFLSALHVAAQEVRLSPDAARYYLEIHDKYNILVQKDSLNQTIIENFTYSVNTRDLYIKNLKDSNQILEDMLSVKDKQLTLSETEKKSLKKKLRTQKIKTVLVAVGSGAIIALIL